MADLDATQRRCRPDYIDAAEIDGELRAALVSRLPNGSASDPPDTIRSPSPGALTARSYDRHAAAHRLPTATYTQRASSSGDGNHGRATRASCSRSAQGSGAART